MNYDMITVGSATVDVFVETDANLITVQHPHSKEQMIAYPSGTKMLIKDLNFKIGGGGTNTAVSFSRLGLETGYVGCLGQDETAQQILTLLKQENIEFLGEIKEGMSGYSVILDSIAEDRTILTYKGVNTLFTFDALNKERLRTKWFYFCAFVNNAYKELEKLADYGKQRGTKIAFNPSSYLAKQGKEYLEFLLSKTDVLILNREEAEMIVGNGSEKMLLSSLAALGPSTVVITDGANPVHALHEGTTYTMVPRHVDVVESTGAGDSFGSSFIAGLILKNDIPFALRLALVNSQSVLGRHGAKEKLLTLQEAEERMAKEDVVVDVVRQ